MIARVGEEKFVFGTDYPMPCGGEPHEMSMYTECLRGLPLPAELRDRILGGNFELFLNGRPDSGRMITASELVAAAEKSGACS
jgi:predicted TIM-barrel fold metal-dependent hydrolase